MNKKISKKIFTAFVTTSLLATLALSNGAVHANTVTNGITVTLEGNTQRVFQPGEKLGIPAGSSRSYFHIATYRNVFIGWSTDKDAVKNESTIYRDTDTIDTVLKEEKTLDNKVLYPIYLGLFDAPTLLRELDANNDSAELSVMVKHNASETLPVTEIKSNEGFTSQVDGVTRKVIAYYDETIEKNYVVLDSNFKWKNKNIPFLVAENPLSILKGTEGITNFSGADVTDYTYVDLLVELDPKLETATEMKNLEFTSGTFAVAAVLDENYQELKSTITKPTSTETVSRFSFENPNQLKKFYVRTVLRNYGDVQNPIPGSTLTTLTKDDIVETMSLTSGDKENVWVSKAVAKEYAENGAIDLVVGGLIQGKVVTDKTTLSISNAGKVVAALIPDSYLINPNHSLNRLSIDFEKKEQPEQPKPNQPEQPKPNQPEQPKPNQPEQPKPNQPEQPTKDVNKTKNPVETSDFGTLGLTAMSMLSLAGMVLISKKK